MGALSRLFSTVLNISSKADKWQRHHDPLRVKPIEHSTFGSSSPPMGRLFETVSTSPWKKISSKQNHRWEFLQRVPNVAHPGGFDCSWRTRFTADQRISRVDLMFSKASEGKLFALCSKSSPRQSRQPQAIMASRVLQTTLNTLAR